MNKIFSLFVFLSSLLILSCDKKPQFIQPSIADLLSIAVSRNFIHIQTQSEIQYLKKNKVKAIAEIYHDEKEQRPDSATFHIYDKNGHLLSSTTSECSSMGCLPNDIRQVFVYSNDTIKVMNDYFFKYKQKSTLAYWQTIDTSRLRFVYDEHYTYKNDTIFVDEMPAIATYIKDKKGNVIQARLDIKTNNQYSVSNFTYTDSTIVQKAINLQGRKLDLNYYYNKERKSIIREFVDGNIETEWLFDNNGLIKQIFFYDYDGKIKNKKSLHYYFYKS